MLKATSVRKSYADRHGPVEVLAGVDLEVNSGEFVCLYGASGSGKTTLLHVVAGLESPDEGSVRIDTQEIAGRSDAERARLRLSRIGVVFQRDNLIPELTVWENVALPLLGLGTAARDSRRLALVALESVGVRELAERKPSKLSGGERQRVGIARGLVGERSVLIADEPTGALDSENSVMLFELLRELAESSHLAVLVATHDPLGTELATRSLTIRDGRVHAT